jgi:hypothetical protein
MGDLESVGAHGRGRHLAQPAEATPGQPHAVAAAGLPATGRHPHRGSAKPRFRIRASICGSRPRNAR